MTNEQREQLLFDCLPKGDHREQVLIDAMRYSLEAGGKRVRPRLVYEFAALCGGSDEAAAPFACAATLPISTERVLPASSIEYVL